MEQETKVFVRIDKDDIGMEIEVSELENLKSDFDSVEVKTEDGFKLVN